MQSTVLELSRYTSDESASSSEWTNRLSRPIPIENGDYIMIKQAFIDTRLIDSNSISIPNDVVWTLRFVYWIQGHSINQQYYADTESKVIPMIPDGLPYMLCDARKATDINGVLRGKPIVDSFNITIKAGTYERPALAEYITRQLQGIKTPQSYQYSSNYFTRSLLVPIYQDAPEGTIFMGFNETNIIDPSKVITTFQKPVFNAQWIQDDSTPEFKYMMMYKDAQGYYRSAVYFPMCTEPNYYDGRQGLGLFSKYGDGNYQINNVYGSNYTLYDGTIIGANQMAFVYNDNNGNSKFSFQYMHTPIVTGGTNGGSESVATYIRTFEDSYLEEEEGTYINAYSGIMLVDTFTDGDTTAFLTQLGFSYNDLVAPDVSKFFSILNNCLDDPDHFYQISYANTFLPYTTRNAMTMAENTSNETVTVDNTQLIANQNVWFSSFNSGKDVMTFSDSTITDGIVASNVPISSNTNAGHYLIELHCSYTNEYITQDKNYQVKAIIGNYFLSGDSFCMSMGPDSYVYQHMGEPTVLTSLKIRILNPITKLPAEELGNNSTVYLQITKEKPVNDNKK
jgi:hypothetical protein